MWEDLTEVFSRRLFEWWKAMNLEDANSLKIFFVTVWNQKRENEEVWLSAWMCWRGNETRRLVIRCSWIFVDCFWSFILLLCQRNYGFALAGAWRFAFAVGESYPTWAVWVLMYSDSRSSSLIGMLLIHAAATVFSMLDCCDSFCS